MRVAFLDHYDSFSFNLIDRLFSDAEIELFYIPYDDRDAVQKLMRAPIPLIVSPGPKRPEVLPDTLSLMRVLLGKAPILGICLGHQCLGHILGGKIGKALNPFHGATQLVHTVGKNELINRFSTTFLATHYNSLIVERATLPPEWVWAVSEAGEVEGIAWHEGRWPAIGVQYHPESFLSEQQQPLFDLWFELVNSYYHGPAET
ncbi:MAG: aminodeoxychorismate/anthranilate synthase component II [Chitinophagaceae bacterium]|nr:aminodeoxychorismate/anthranilate synthase component II [Oligoflexus sp.]